MTLNLTEVQVQALKILAKQNPDKYQWALDMYEEQQNPNRRFGPGKNRYYVRADYRSLSENFKYFNDYYDASEYKMKCNHDFSKDGTVTPYYIVDTVLEHKYD